MDDNQVETNWWTDKYLKTEKGEDGEDPIMEAKLQIGQWEVELRAPRSKLAETIQKVLSQMPESLAHPHLSSATSKRKNTLRDGLANLLAQGWFREERSLNEVEDIIRDRGYFPAAGSVSHGLMDMVREGRLSRLGYPKRFRYRSR